MRVGLQILGQVLAVASGGFETGLHRLDRVLFEPGPELVKLRRCVGEGATEVRVSA
jgi:hypothetical protein